MDDIAIGGMTVDEEFQVGVIIAKLPAKWNDYKKKLKHQEKKFTLDEITRHLHIEEESRKRDGEWTEITSHLSRANLVEGESSDKKLKKKVIPLNGKSFKNKGKNTSDVKKWCFFLSKTWSYYEKLLTLQETS